MAEKAKELLALWSFSEVTKTLIRNKQKGLNSICHLLYVTRRSCTMLIFYCKDKYCAYLYSRTQSNTEIICGGEWVH